MKTKIYLLVVLFILAVSVNAQTKAAAKDTKSFTIGAGAMVGLPMGDGGDVFSLAYGVDLQGEFTIAPSLGLTLSAGYGDWIMKSKYKDVLDAAGIDIKTSYIPVLAGVKYYFSDKLYGSAQAGLSFYSESAAGNVFTYAPGIGYKIGEKFDLLLKYQKASGDSFLALRVGITF